jgi:threonine synthase
VASVSELTREAIDTHLNGGQRRVLRSAGAFRSGRGDLSTRVDEIFGEIAKDQDVSLGRYDPDLDVITGAEAKERRGAMAQVTDDEIRAGIQLLARTTGVFAETAGGVTIAVLRKLSESGALDTGQETVVYNTGDGLKTLEAVSDRAQLTAVVPPTVKAIRTAGLL